MISYIVLALGIAAVSWVAFYSVNSATLELKGSVTKYYLNSLTVEKKIELLANTAQKLAEDFSRLRLEMDVLREQVMKMREDHLNLKSDVANKRPIIKLPLGAIPVEVHQSEYNPPKNLGKKSKKESAK